MSTPYICNTCEFQFMRPDKELGKPCPKCHYQTAVPRERSRPSSRASPRRLRSPQPQVISPRHSRSPRTEGRIKSSSPRNNNRLASRNLREDLEPETSAPLAGPGRVDTIEFECETCAYEWLWPATNAGKPCPRCRLMTAVPVHGLPGGQDIQHEIPLDEEEEKARLEQEAFDRIDRFLDRRFTYYTNMMPISTGMNTMKWSKMLREMRFYDPNLRVDKTRGDIIFTRNKQKGSRSLNFIEFGFAVEELAAHLLPDYGADALAALTEAVRPLAKKTRTPKTTSVFSRLTDHTLYTGAHKSRFDKHGRGRGKAGRVNVAEDISLRNLVQRHRQPPPGSPHRQPGMRFSSQPSYARRR